MNEVYNYLMHYGVPGMKWGVRKAIEDNGSLSRVGKQRLYTDEERKQMYKNSSKSNGATEKSGDAKYLGQQRGAVNKSYDDYRDSLGRDLERIKNDPNFRKQVKSELDQKFGESKDPDLYHDVDDYIMKSVEKNLSQETLDKYKSFDDNCRVYMNNLKDITDDVVGKYGDEVISRKTGEKYRDATEARLDKIANKNASRYSKYFSDAQHVPDNQSKSKLYNPKGEIEDYHTMNMYSYKFEAGKSTDYDFISEIASDWNKSRRNKNK